MASFVFGLAWVSWVGAAEIESIGHFGGGFSSTGPGSIQSQSSFAGGLGAARFSTTDGSVSGESGPLAAVQNPPVVGEDRANFIASLGDSLDISYADIAFLSGITELDGESLGFQVEASAGDLSQNGTPTARVELQAGQRFLWNLPESGSLADLVMTVVGIDQVALSSSASPLGIEDAGAISVSVKASDGASLGVTAPSNLGDVQVPAGTTTEVYTISNDSFVSDSGVTLEAIEAEAETWSESDQQTGLVVLRQPPPRSSKLSVTEIDLEGAAAGDFEIGEVTLPFFLAPGESETFSITFRPQEPGDRLASVGLVRPGNPNGFFEFGVRGFGNQAPNGAADEIVRAFGLEPIKIRVADLLFNDRDLDGDMVRFAGLVAPLSARGRTLEVLNDQWLVYYPGVPDETPDDQFEYDLSDGRGAFSTSVVTIREEALNGTAGAIETTLVAGPGQPVTIRVRGIPGRVYQAQFTNQLNPPNTVWTDLGAPTTASPQNGGFQITDPQAPPGQRIYRIIEAPQQP